MVPEKDPQPSHQGGEREASMTVEITCPNCNLTKRIAREKIPPGVRRATCPRCNHRFEFVLPEDFENAISEKGPGPGARRAPPPWEDRATFGTGHAILQTLKSVLFSPISFFRRADTHGGMREPFAFGLLIGSIGMMVEVFWQFVMMGESLSSMSEGLFGPVAIGLLFLGGMILCPVFVALILFMASIIAHLCLMVMRGATHGFEATFRVMAYSQGTHVWGLIPFVGGAIGGIWLLVVQVIGLREIHETSYLRVIVALLLPFAFSISVFMAVLIALMNFD